MTGYVGLTGRGERVPLFAQGSELPRVRVEGSIGAFGPAGQRGWLRCEAWSRTRSRRAPRPGTWCRSCMRSLRTASRCDGSPAKISLN
jgi:hypothetical protein